MKIKQAFPEILNRQYPIVKGKYPLLTVLYLLRINDVDAVPIVPLAKKGARAVFGFLSLPLLITMKTEEFAEALKGPCEVASDELTLLNIEDDLITVYKALESRKLGFALVHEAGKSSKHGLLSLADILELIRTGSVKSDMTGKDLGNPVFSMPGHTTIREALKAMFRYRYRRVFLSGVDAYISDRSIMSYLFNPLMLQSLTGRKDDDILSNPISSLERISPINVNSDSSLKIVASRLAQKRGTCILTEEKKLITPWDAVMKPWASGSFLETK